MRFQHGVHDSVQLFLSRLVHSVLSVFPDNGLVGRNFNDIHAIDIAELPLLRKRRTGHTRFLFKQIKEILEGNIGERLALALYLHMLLCLDCLMQTVRITAPRHNTTGKFVYNQHLIVLDYIVLIPKHQVVGSQRQNNIMLYFQILRVRKVLNAEEFFYLFHAGFRQVDYLILFIDNKVAGFLLYHAHNRIDFGQILHILATL